jgi:hypothetical protein
MGGLTATARSTATGTASGNSPSSFKVMLPLKEKPATDNGEAGHIAAMAFNAARTSSERPA